MNRIGYGIVAALVIALLAYAFWPEALKQESVALRQGPAPTSFTVRVAGVEQRIEGSTDRLAGLDRPVDAMRVSSLWEFIASISAPRDKVVAAAEGDLAAYGIDGSREIVADNLRLRWGQVGGLGYCWDGRRVLCVPTAVVDRLDAAAKRLDDQALQAGGGALDRIAIERLDGAAPRSIAIERRSDGQWIDRDRAARPSMMVRASRLEALIGALKLDSLGAPSAGGVSLIMKLSLHGGAPARDHLLQLERDGDGALVVLDSLPPQHLDAVGLAAWKRVCGDLERDLLLDLDVNGARIDTVRFAVELGGKPWFAVERRQASYRPGETDYDLSWSGGRETASEESLFAGIGELADIAVERAEPGPDPAPASPLARRFRLLSQNGGQLELTIDGDRAWTPAFHGRMTHPTELAKLQPAALLDLALVTAPPERVSKVQVRRLDAQPEQAEVVARSEDGAWSRTFPTRAPVDAVAVGRLAKAFCAARAASARLLDDEDRAALAHPLAEVDLRLEPKAKGAPSMEIADERDTVPQDRGFALYRDAAGAWRAMDVEGGVSYSVDEDLVEIARRPLESDVAYPVVPGLVRRIEIVHGVERFALDRGDGGWRALDLPAAGQAAGPGSPADELQVRRLLRALSELRATGRLPKAPALLPARAAAVVACIMPGAGGDERLTLSLAEPEAGAAEASVDSTSASTVVPPGRVRLALAALAEVAPPRAQFLRPAQ